ncbi:MAG: TetR/AcrR family transcriptional regulator [Oscillochloris sp.]|nr:TetR/AcrR family transcriptional regulator [Oscillochloris sp.]
MTDDRARWEKRNAQAAPPPQRRRAPVQERAKQQVNRILDAAAELIAEVGVDNATTNAIAARVRISVGTLYQYFPNKEALVRALAVRYLEALDAVLPVPLDADPARWSLPEEVGRAIQVLERFIKEHPGFPHVYRAARGASDPESTQLLDHGKAHFEAIFAHRAPWVRPEERRAHATVVVEAAHSLLVVASMLESADHQQLIRELMIMLVRYLDPVYGDGMPAA